MIRIRDYYLYLSSIYIDMLSIYITLACLRKLIFWFVFTELSDRPHMKILSSNHASAT